MSDSEYKEMKLGQSIRDALGMTTTTGCSQAQGGHTSYVLLRLAAKLGEHGDKSDFLEMWRFIMKKSIVHAIMKKRAFLWEDSLQSENTKECSEPFTKA